ncbi:hypothetical protein VJ923_06120 [Adlercreutzia sp. R25]|uniref:Zinc ribbon domain-containing protein n=1 Tax=Adlercreutzia shanghongiae TaxID=3111773 RepID=A0ABU6IXE1_9ACTN|nr:MULTISPECIES: hypothetical protein [unclassified Adlercreutzia]MEC4272728.1 hypothetical protein [Adlercreutzia sp. R25]MEC4294373.1 hypothetical protein [Adlercreutzia sp. R22]
MAEERGGRLMDDLIQWEPQDSQHLTAKVVMRNVLGDEDPYWELPCCSFCDEVVPGDADRYCRNCGAKFEKGDR